MAMTPSTMLDLGTELPAFSLPDFDGHVVSSADLREAKGLLLVFVSVHCPFVKLIQQELGHFGAEYGPKGLALVAVGSNDLATHPQDGPDGMREQATAHGWTFPYLVDRDQALARACKAACTPDFFLFDGDRKLVYRGQFDDARPGKSVPVTGKDLRAAVDLLLAGQAIPAEQIPSIGCNIKWLAGAEPAYYAG